MRDLPKYTPKAWGYQFTEYTAYDHSDVPCRDLAQSNSYSELVSTILLEFYCRLQKSIMAHLPMGLFVNFYGNRDDYLSLNALHT
jgi:hypothetical protein